jgi:hypothetical protein
MSTHKQVQAMSEDPKDGKRSADGSARADLIAKMPPDDGKNKAAEELAQAGARKRSEPITPEKRTQIARKAALKRWRDR